MKYNNINTVEILSNALESTVQELAETRVELTEVKAELTETQTQLDMQREIAISRSKKLIGERIIKEMAQERADMAEARADATEEELRVVKAQLDELRDGVINTVRYLMDSENSVQMGSIAKMIVNAVVVSNTIEEVKKCHDKMLFNMTTESSIGYDEAKDLIGDYNALSDICFKEMQIVDTELGDFMNRF